MRAARDSISLAEARRIVLAAQGLARPRPRSVTRAAVLHVVERLGLVQMDSVNVLCRAHYMPVFSRLGPYPVGHLERAAYAEPRALFEYRGHEASLVPVSLHPLLRWRMKRAERLEGIYGRLVRFASERRDYVERVYDEVAARGPLRAAELSTSAPRASSWWSWSDAKTALEWLFWAGRLTTAARPNFERVYDVPERVLPADVLAAHTPEPADAQRELLRIAARALGVATEEDLRDYFRLKPAEARPRLAELVDEGAIVPVRLEGVRGVAYLARAARAPREASGRALLSPFDPLLWCRPRTERLFDFRYRLEIYTPAHLREHGYYVLPFLLGERLVARVDLKASRAVGTLDVRAAHTEHGEDARTVADALATELRLMADWLGLERVTVARRGRLAKELARAVRAS